MELTRRCDYAFRILRSAYRHQDAYVSIADVAKEEDIPYAFARTIQHDLATAGYLRTVRGAKGGLVLSCDPEKVTLLDVLRSLQGPIEVAACATDPSTCSKSASCTINRIWIAADEALNSLMGSLTLKTVFDGTPDGEYLANAREMANASVAASVEEILSGNAPISCNPVSADA